MQVETYSDVSSSERFVYGSYNGFSIIIRQKDYYINATKMVRLINEKENLRKQLKTYFKSHEYRDLSEELTLNLMTNELGKILPAYYYELNSGFSKEIAGTYVHPKLINAIAMWASPKYHLRVSLIMDTINKRTQLTGELFETVADELIETQRKLIKELEETCESKSEEIKEQTIVIHHNSVRTGINNKMLYIFSHGENFKLSSNSTRKPSNILHTYIFPATMNMRQDVCWHFGLNKLVIPNDRLDDVLQYLNEKNPKLKI